MDGIKYHRTEQDYFDMQRESDRLCREYGLSVIENPQRGKSKHYGEWRAEQEGRPTYLSLIKADVDTAIRQSMTERQFFYHLRQMGYDIKVGKDITVRPPNYPRGRKLMRNFGEDYSMENIRRRILAQRRPQREHRPEPFRCRLHGDLKQAKKVTGFRALYFHYCYLLGVFPQKQNRPPRRVPHTLREDLIRAQELTDEARLLSRHRIDTLEQLNAYRSDVESQLAGLTEQRKSLYRKLRTKAVLADPARQEHIRAEISKLSAQIKELRREVKLCGDIALRSTSIKDMFALAFAKRPVRLRLLMESKWTSLLLSSFQNSATRKILIITSLQAQSLLICFVQIQAHLSIRKQKKRSNKSKAKLRHKCGICVRQTPISASISKKI